MINIRNKMNRFLAFSLVVFLVATILPLAASAQEISGTVIYGNTTDDKCFYAGTSIPIDSSKWKIVPGLTDATCISIQSVDNPHYYLRHYEGNLMISEDDGTEIFRQDATWRIVPGLANSNGVSFVSYNISGTYIRHYNSYLIISPIESEIDRLDATFVLIGQ